MALKFAIIYHFIYVIIYTIEDLLAYVRIFNQGHNSFVYYHFNTINIFKLKLIKIPVYLKEVIFQKINK